MIHEIRIDNFYSIRREQILDLRVPGTTPDQDRFRPSPSSPGIRLPTTVVLFGANASGKTTVLRALNSLISFAAHSFVLDPEGVIPGFMPFLSTQDWHRPTRLTAEFDASWLGDQPQRYRYELHLANDGPTPPRTVAYEALSFAPDGRMRRLFARSGRGIRTSREFDLRDTDPRLASVRPNASVVSTLARLNHALSARIHAELLGRQTNLSGLNRREADLGRVFAWFAQHTEALAHLNRELDRLDLGLRQMELLPGARGPVALFHHSGLERPVSFDEESGGTQRFVMMFPSLLFALANGGLVILDELDADLHPLLLPEILRWFHDPGRNPHAAQLWLTAHHATLLDELEKEEVFFTEKDDQGATTVFSARQIKGLRREPSLSRKYLGGVFGAVPQVG